jgi:hypothetical protein
VASNTALAKAAPEGPYDASPAPKNGMPGRSIKTISTGGTLATNAK